MPASEVTTLERISVYSLEALQKAIEALKFKVDPLSPAPDLRGEHTVSLVRETLSDGSYNYDIVIKF